MLVFDEMSVHSTGEYDKRTDSILGPHKQLLVVLIRGLFTKWKQPVYFNFDIVLNSELFFEVVRSLEDTGVEVVAVVCDMGSINMRLWKELNVSSETPYIVHPMSIERKIFFFADFPHILKNLRNHCLDHGLEIPGNNKCTVDRALFEMLLASHGKEYKMCHKVSDGHITVRGTKRQRVRPAAQLFSETVASALEHKFNGQFDKQAAVIRLMDQTFDVMNSRIPYNRKKPLNSGFGRIHDQQKQTLEDAMLLMSAARVKGKKSLLPFQNGFLASCRSLLQLFDYLTDRCDIQYILTHRLTQDCIESYFSKIRGIGGFNDHPTPLACIYRIRCLLVGATDGSIVSAAANTTPDKDESFTLSASILSKLTRSETQSNSDIPLEEPLHNLPSTLSESEEDGLTYVSGYVAAKLRAQYPDLGCPTYKADKTNSWLSKLSTGGLCQPSDKWLNNCKLLEKIFISMNGEGIMQKNPLFSLLQKAKIEPGDDFIELACRLFLKTRIFIRLKNVKHGQ